MNIFSSIPEAIEEIKKGNMLIVLDTDREHEADFFIPAQNITPQLIMTMIRYAGGLIVVALTQKKAHQLDIPLMVNTTKNTESTKLNLTISVNAKCGITTGVSAFDRAKTIKLLSNPTTKPEDLTRPGHVSCTIANSGGILKRKGHTEAAVDISRLAGCSPAGVLCEIIRQDGKMAEAADLISLSEKLSIKIITINDLVDYIKKNPLPALPDDLFVAHAATSVLPTSYGKFNIKIYKSTEDNLEHAVLLLGNISKQPILTRIHSQCLTGDTFLSLRCDCREQLHKSMQQIQKEDKGIIIYLNQEGRGIGLINKIKAYALQDKGYDTVEANEQLGFPPDARDYKIAADILKNMGITKIKLLTNNPDKKNQLSQHGIEIIKQIPLEIVPNKKNKKYLTAKKEKLGHQLENV